MESRILFLSFSLPWFTWLFLPSFEHSLIGPLRRTFFTFAALTGQELAPEQLADSKNVLPALVSEPSEPLRDHLILSPRHETHISLRKGKWMYIPARSSGGFRLAEENKSSKNKEIFWFFHEFYGASLSLPQKKRMVVL